MSNQIPAYAESLVTNTHGRQYWIYTDDVFYQQRIANAGPYQKKNLLRLRLSRKLCLVLNHKTTLKIAQ